MDILGYRRPDGQLGIRNKVSIVYTTHCSLVVSQKLQNLFPVRTQLFGYPGGCALRDGPVNKIVALANHSSSAAVLVVGLGCEGTDAYMVADRIAKSGRPVEAIKINAEGGDLKAIEKGSRILVKLLQYASQVERAPMTPADLIVGQECGGSDATSGLASNPITGVAADLLIDAGGTYMHSETSELMGCADILAARSVNEQVAQEIREAIEEAERDSFSSGRFSWGYGNILGGLTSIEEKSYGCLAKSGTKPLQGVLKEYKLPPGKGYYIQVGEPGSGTFHGDPEGVNQFAACGAHICLFTTGCGSTTGGLIPVIKVIANPKRMQLIQDNADFDATPVIRGEKTIQQMGEELYQEILTVAAGKLTKSEIYGHHEA
ncbi:MAG: UxaA family hydrolase [Chloroflexi bacterium]|nr:UxaA family hydrolase [Chloroflexota bacterium]